jgi:hypothetical protein
MRAIRIVAAISVCFAAIGCHSALISATVSNHQSTPVSVIEFGYPSASFGIQKLAPGEDYHYRFKVIGRGPTTLLWKDSDNHDQKSSGPILREGDEGSLTVTFTAADANPTWDVRLNRPTQR